MCETLLKSPLQKTIPTDCPTKTIKANLEIWHRLSENSWLFIISERSLASISCDRTNAQIPDVELEGTGIFNMSERCKCYTLSTVLTSTSNQSTEHLGYMPAATVLEDDCCRTHHQFLQNDIQMEPVKLQDLNLDDLRHSQHKLKQFEELLDHRLHESHFLHPSSWFTTTVAILLLFLLVILFCCCCCNCSWLPYIGTFFPKRRNCCELPSICITNHNEGVRLNEEQIMRLSRLRNKPEDTSDSDGHSVCEAVSSASDQRENVANDVRPRKFFRT